MSPGNGEIVRVGDTAALAAAMLYAAEADLGPEARAERARSVAGITPDAFAEDLVRAAELAAGAVRNGRDREAA